MAGKPEAFKLKMYKTQGEDVERDRADCTVGQFNHPFPKTGRRVELNDKSRPPFESNINLAKKQAETICTMENPSLLLLLSIAGFLAIVGVELALLLIQYISDKLSLNLFCALISIAIFFHILVALSIVRLKEKSFQQLQPVGSGGCPEGRVQSLVVEQDCPTVLNIRKGGGGKDNEKTKKLSKAVFSFEPKQNNGETIKKIVVENKTSKHPDPSPSVTSNQEGKLFLVMTLLQNGYEFSLAVICLSTIENPNPNGLTYVTGLISLGFLLLIASSCLAVHLYLCVAKEVPQKNIPAKKNQILLEYNEHIEREREKEEEKLPTALSIEQHLQEQKPQVQKQLQEEGKKDCKSLQKVSNQQVKIPIQLQRFAESLAGLKRGRSVLKAAKSFRSHFDSGHEDDEEDFQDKRKVEIDFRRNEIFEYQKSSVNSPKNSIHDSISRTSQKSNSKYVKSKYAIPHRNICDAGTVYEHVQQERRKCKSAQKASQYSQAQTIAHSTLSKFKDLYV